MTGTMTEATIDAPLSGKDKLFCFGAGYCARSLAALLEPLGVEVAGTSRGRGGGNGEQDLGSMALVAFDGRARSAAVAERLAGTTHVLVSIPPGEAGDVVLQHHAADLEALPSLRWIGYLSTVGVYGDTDGAWVDETAIANPGSPRARRRLVAEGQWRDFVASSREQSGRRLDVFRLPGIYGPGRSAIEQVRAGTARRVIKPGQVFNRVHVADIAGALARAMTRAVALPPRGQARAEIYNLADDEPAPPQDVVAFAAQLLGVPPPPEVPLEAADLSEMASSFYRENRRVRNQRLGRDLGYVLRYPTYREGLRSIAATSPIWHNT